MYQDENGNWLELKIRKLPEKHFQRQTELMRKRSPAESIFIQLIEAKRFLTHPFASSSSTRWSGIRILQQYPIHGFYADFAVRRNHVVFEIDGKHHLKEPQLSYDRNRDLVFSDHGWKVYRIPAWAVMYRKQAVLEFVEAAARSRTRIDMPVWQHIPAPVVVPSKAPAPAVRSKTYSFNRYVEKQSGFNVKRGKAERKMGFGLGTDAAGRWLRKKLGLKKPS